MNQSFDELMSNDKPLFTRNTLAILLPILLAAAVLRFIHLGQSPPGLNQDEAVNAWNAWCLLKTGTDQYGVSWPIFYFRGLGGNGSTLYLYLLLPFQAIGGLNVITMRLPAAVGGMVTILLIYYVGARLFDRKVGLLAAALLTFNPWHIQQSRWGHEASVCSLLGLLPIAMLLWANFPLADNIAGPPKPLRAAIAGAAAGISCYGYQALRIFIPVLLFVTALTMLPALRRFIKTRKGFLSLTAFVLTFTLTFGPMVWQYIFHPKDITRHNAFVSKAWEGLTFPTLLYNVVIRYIKHFGLDFLFIHGDRFSIQSPPNMGVYHWYVLPLMLAGLVIVGWRIRQSLSVRLLVIFILVYPLADSLFPAASLHALRSSPGLCSLVLLGALGGTEAARWLYKRNRILMCGLAVVFLAAVIVSNVRYLRYFYGGYNRDPFIYRAFHVDLLEACDWLRSRYDNYDAVVCTSDGMNMPYMITLVALSYDPHQWFRDLRMFYTNLEWDYYTRYGKMMFIPPAEHISNWDELRQRLSGKRVLLIVRPGGIGLKNPIYRICDPTGKDSLWLCRL